MVLDRIQFQRRSFAILLLLPALAWCFSVQPAATRMESPIRKFSSSVASSAFIRTRTQTILNDSDSKGFGPTTTTTNQEEPTKKEKTPTPTKESSTENVKRIYSAPALYDLAMGYRNYDAEVDFLLDAHKECSKQKSRPTSVLEVASGPGRHCLEALKSERVVKAAALDISPEMVEYGKGVAKEELEEEQMSQFTFLCDDMRTFELEEQYDSAWILAGSLQHMTTNEDVIQSLTAIHKTLSPQGTVIIELPHPNEVFQMIDSTTNSWEVPLEDDNGKEYGELQVVWGDEKDEIDPIQQVRQNTVVLKLKGVNDPEKQSINGTVPLKLFTAQEIELFARCTGFEVAAMYGALNEEVDINDEDTAYRLVSVLRKV